VAIRTDFLVRGVVRRRRGLRGLNTSSEEIGRNVHAHSVRFSWMRFFACQPKDAHQNLGRVVRRVREARPRSSDNTSNEKIGACSHGFTLTGTATATLPRGDCLHVYYDDDIVR